MFSQNNN